jgi:Spy/CpxP family protein refolding chaperone
MAGQIAWMLSVALLSAAPSSVVPVCDQQQQRPAHDAAKKPEAPSGNSQRVKWWLDPESRKEIGVTDQQSKQIDLIFESTMPKQRERLREIETLREALSETIKANTADVATVALQVEKVENVSAEFRKIRTMMIYRMNAVLTSEQRAKLEKFEEKMRARARRDERRDEPKKR